MSQVIDLCEDSDDNGEQPMTASVPSLPLSGKRPRNKEESSNYAHLRNKNGPRDKFEDEVEVSPNNKKRRGVVKSERNAKNDAAGKGAQIVSDDAQGADHRESHEGIAASYPMNSYSDLTSRDDGSADEYSQKLPTSKPPSNASGRQFSASAWGSRSSELAEYRKIHGHYNVPQRNSEYTKLANWVTYQRRQYKVHLEGKESKMTTFRIPELKSLDFYGGVCTTAWEDHLSELAAYNIIQGNCNVPRNYSENPKLAAWVGNQRINYRLYQEGKTSNMTTFRIQELESLGFEWNSHGAAWEDHFNDLANYRIIQGHCNVPQYCSENSKLAAWVRKQRCQYRLHLKGESSPMTNFRIQELERLGFEWDNQCATWEARLSELAEYRKIHGHCNVPQRCSEYFKLANWVAYQRRQYKENLKGNRSYMTISRIQEMESLGFDWGVCATAWEERLSELAEYRIIHGHCKVPRSYSENAKLATWVGTQRTHYRLHVAGEKSSMTTLRIQQLESIGFEWDSQCTAWDDRLNELADYCIGHGHCNVPQHCSENTKLAKWIGKQRCNYRLHLKGKSSPMTTFRIQELESLGFEWDNQSVTWEARLSELAEYRNINGHCNVPGLYNENTKLANWVAYQKRQYKLHLQGKPSPLTLSRIQALENIGLNVTAPVPPGKTD
jgi:hypothetical protein